MNLRKAVLTDPERRRDLAAIHVAKKQLGMEDDTYRDMLWAIVREIERVDPSLVESARDAVCRPVTSHEESASHG